MIQDGDSWGIYAQLHNDAGVKIGDNIRVNKNTLGPQHSPRITILADDTALILYIDGNQEEGAMIKGVRFTNQLLQIGTEFEFTWFTFLQQDAYFNYITSIIALSNGGFVVGYIEGANFQSNNQLIFLFYDQTFNQVTRITRNISSLGYYDLFSLASTFSTVAVYYKLDYYQQQVSLYSFDGDLLVESDIPNGHRSDFPTKLGSSDQYYVTVQEVISYLTSKSEYHFQLYTHQFVQYGSPIIIDTISYINIDHQSSYIQISSYNSGFFIVIHISGISNYLLQYFVNLNWEVTKFKDLNFKNKNRFDSKMGFTFVGTPLQHYYIISQKLNSLFYYNRDSDTWNIALQKFSKSGEQLEINEFSCTNNCLECDKNNTCTTCLQNYKMWYTRCTPICEEHCSYCDTPSFCDTCSSGYFQKIVGKCQPFPNDYIQPEKIFTLSQKEDISWIESVSKDQFIIFNSQVQLLQLYIFQNNTLLKQITLPQPEIPNNRINYYRFYVDENLIFVIYTQDKIYIRRYNSDTQSYENLQMIIPTSVGSWQNIVLEPIENNQYSVIYTTQSNWDWKVYVYHAILDSELNFVDDFRLILTLIDDYQGDKNKNCLLTRKYEICGDKIKQFYLRQYKIISKDIFQLQNNNLIAIIMKNDDIKMQTYFDVRKLYYCILDSNYQPLTNQAKVIDNNYFEEEFMNIFIFDDSFTIVLRQRNYFYPSNFYVVSQRFDNSGAKITPYSLIEHLINFQWTLAIQQNEEYLVIWQVKSTYQKDLFVRKYNKNGTELSFLNNCTLNCAQCTNSQHCVTCFENYLLDEKEQCKLICPDNCNTCNVLNFCQTCIQGYKLIDEKCIQIQCISNCVLCQQDNICSKCAYNYEFNADNSQCLPICASNCISCTIPLQCDVCSDGYLLTTSKTCFEVVNPPTMGSPVTAYFENGDFVVLWYQIGEDEGVYFQLYTKDGNKFGDITKVGVNANRRLLIENNDQQFAADLAINKQEFIILWLDASKQNTVANVQKFDSLGQQLTEILELGIYPQVNLSTISKPCQIIKADNNMIVAFFTQSENTDYSLMVQTYDMQLQQKSAQQIHNVNIVSPPTISYSEGSISISYSSQGYLFIQKLTKDGNLIDQPVAISDPNQLTIRTTTLKNGMIVFEWENKGASHTLNYQLISKDLKTRSEVMGIDTKNIAELSPDLKSFNEGFISAWQIIASEFLSPKIQFQIFNSLGGATTDVIDLVIDGLFPTNPSIQVINESLFAITCSGKKIDSEGKIQGDTIFIEKFNSQGQLIQDLPSNALCSYKCESCKSPLNCFKCATGYQLNDQKQCIIDCGGFCESCIVPFVCKKCIYGYNLADNKVCEEIGCLEGYIRNEKTKQCEPKCSFQCEYCKEPNECLVCGQDYALSNGECEPRITDIELITSEIILIAFVVLQSAFLIGFIIIFVCQRKQIKQIKLKLIEASQANEALRNCVAIESQSNQKN